MARLSTEILIVGGGPAGLSAALSAAAGAAVTIIDDNATLGGQIWRAELGKTGSPAAKQIIDAVDSGEIAVVNSAQVFASSGDRTLIAQTPKGCTEIEFQKLIIATGARERFLPFPGWTLPNVFGAGGLQALAKGGLPVKGKRIVVSGTGPLLIAVAEYLKAKGAKVAAVVEQTSAAKLRRFGIGLWSAPSKLVQAAVIKARLLDVPYLTDCWVTAANGVDRLASVTLSRRGRTWDVECDMLACGFHLVPNTELAALLGCGISNGLVSVDEFQRSSLEDIYCVGEPTGIAGLESSLVEGSIAGCAASGDIDKARRQFAKRDRARRFGDGLNNAFALRDELKTLADLNTIVCRCEDVSYGTLTEFRNTADAKLQTRCGMGACQGRICGAANEFLFGWRPGTVRPPIFPVKMENL
ncbi:MAG: FAD-dependent oxidoreductase [Chloracidobacterium sp.]|nr:FAD-dependent oxidoreductase [Chloracidobacterium sp.]